MIWLYLDESGDLGFDFVNKRPSNFFTVSIIATSSSKANDKFTYAVRKTLKRKVNKKNQHSNELKGYSTNLNVKKYLWNQIKDEKFGCYSITLNKKKLYQYLIDNKPRTYNYIARLVVDQIPFEKTNDIVYFIVDKSKGKLGIKDFNTYISLALEGSILILKLIYFI